MSDGADKEAVEGAEDAPPRPGEGSRVDTHTNLKITSVRPAPRPHVAEREPSVVVVSGAGIGTLYRLRDKPISVGRSSDNTVPVDDIGVSRRHAIFERIDQQVVARDLGSKNGTFVNGERAQARVLRDGDLVVIGETTFKFLPGDSVEQSYYERLHVLALQDELTGLPNRRYFDEVLSRECARARRHGRALALLIADIDHFKQVNDTWGHVMGDMVLRDFSQLLADRVRKSELLARYGGEEFAFVLPETDHEGCFVFAEVVRHRVAEHEFVYGEQRIPITVSIGGAVWQDGMGDAVDLVRAADACLYQAKAGGRNRVVM